MQTRLRWLVLALCCLVAATPAAAQETGSISGYTFDATGTAVAGVTDHRHRRPTARRTHRHEQ